MLSSWIKQQIFIFNLFGQNWINHVFHKTHSCKNEQKGKNIELNTVTLCKLGCYLKKDLDNSLMLNVL